MYRACCCGGIPAKLARYQQNGKLHAAERADSEGCQEGADLGRQVHQGVRLPTLILATVGTEE